MPRHLDPTERRRRELRQSFLRYQHHRYRELRAAGMKWRVLLNRAPLEQKAIQRAERALMRLRAAETRCALARRDDPRLLARDEAAKARRRLWLIRQPWARVSQATRARYEAAYAQAPATPSAATRHQRAPAPPIAGLDDMQSRIGGSRA